MKDPLAQIRKRWGYEEFIPRAVAIEYLGRAMFPAAWVGNAEQCERASNWLDGHHFVEDSVPRAILFTAVAEAAFPIAGDQPDSPRLTVVHFQPVPDKVAALPREPAPHPREAKEAEAEFDWVASQCRQLIRRGSAPNLEDARWRMYAGRWSQILHPKLRTVAAECNDKRLPEHKLTKVLSRLQDLEKEWALVCQYRESHDVRPDSSNEGRAEFISRAQAGELLGNAQFPADWGRWLNERQRELIDWYGRGSAPQPGTLFFSDYDPFEPTLVGDDYADLQEARQKYWRMRWQKDRVDNLLNERGLIGRRFSRVAFENAFPEALSAEPPHCTELASEQGARVDVASDGPALPTGVGVSIAEAPRLPAKCSDDDLTADAEYYIVESLGAGTYPVLDGKGKRSDFGAFIVSRGRTIAGRRTERLRNAFAAAMRGLNLERHQGPASTRRVREALDSIPKDRLDEILARLNLSKKIATT